jgi:hypothetical protein
VRHASQSCVLMPQHSASLRVGPVDAPCFLIAVHDRAASHVLVTKCTVGCESLLDGGPQALETFAREDHPVMVAAGSVVNLKLQNDGHSTVCVQVGLWQRGPV